MLREVFVVDKQRVQCIDIVKGLAILIVVMGHLVDNSDVSSFVSKCIGMALGSFFILASYFYKPGQGYLSNVKKRVFQLVIPLLVWNLVVIVLCFLYETIVGSAAEITDYLKAYWNRIYDSSSLTAINLGAESTSSVPSVYGESIVNMVLNPSWFLNRLFFTELIFFAVADWALKKLWRVCVAMAALLTVTFLYTQFFSLHLPMQLDSCFALAALLLFGSYMRKLDFAKYIEKSRWDRKKLILTGIILACFIAAKIWLTDFFGDQLQSGRFGSGGSVSVYIWFVCMILSFYVMMLIGSLLSHVPFVSGGLKRIGMHTLMILLFHMLIGKMVLYILWRILVADPDASMPLWASAIAVVIAVTLSMLISIARDKVKAKIAARRKKAAVT